MTRGAPTECSHPDVLEGRCITCGVCSHDVVLNGACYFCGASGLDVTVKPIDRAQDSIVPVDRLRRRP